MVAVPETAGVHWKTRSGESPELPQPPASRLDPLVVPLKVPPCAGMTVGLLQSPGRVVVGVGVVVVVGALVVVVVEVVVVDAVVGGVVVVVVVAVVVVGGPVVVVVVDVVGGTVVDVAVPLSSITSLERPLSTPFAS